MKDCSEGLSWRTVVDTDSDESGTNMNDVHNLLSHPSLDQIISLFDAAEY